MFSNKKFEQFVQKTFANIYGNFPLINDQLLGRLMLHTQNKGMDAKDFETLRNDIDGDNFQPHTK